MKMRIEQDTDPMNPRTEWDNFGTMICFHRSYILGDKHDYRESDYGSWGEVKKAIEGNEDPAVILPLFLFDHSGITMSCESSRFRMADSAGWDWGQVGFIFVSKAKLREEFSKKRISKKLLAKAEEILVGEVKTYDQYLTGDVWGYIIEDDKGEHIDSCWGFFGHDYCEDEAKSQLEYWEKEEAQREPSMVPAPVCCQT